MTRKTSLPSPALVVSAIALVAAMGGTALALPGGGKVEANDIRRGAVKSQAIHHRAVTSPKIQRQAVRGGKLARNAVKGGKIRAGAVKAGKIAAAAVATPNLASGAVTGAKIANDAIDDSKLAQLDLIPLTRVAATSGTDADAARAAAPPAPLFKKGALALYAKCFTDSTADITYAYVYAATAANGSLLVSGQDTLTGNPYLDTTTAEVDREVWGQNAANNSASGFRNQYEVAAPDGTALQGLLAAYAKNGDVVGGNGVYGNGDVCLFSGTANG